MNPARIELSVRKCSMLFYSAQVNQQRPWLQDHTAPGQLRLRALHWILPVRVPFHFPALGLPAITILSHYHHHHRRFNWFMTDSDSILHVLAGQSISTITQVGSSSPQGPSWASAQAYYGQPRAR